MLGANKFGAADFTKLLTAGAFLKSDKADGKGFVTINVGSTTANTFNLDINRVRELTEVVQFLEKQDHDIKDAVEYRRVQEMAEEEKA